MKKYFSIGAVSAVIILIVFAYVSPPQIAPSPLLSPPSRLATTTATLTVGTTTYSVEIRSGETVLEAMRALASTSDFSFTSREYAGLGTFVDSINGKKGADGMSWILYVNEVSATSGAGATLLHAGDTAAWRYEKNF